MAFAENHLHLNRYRGLLADHLSMCIHIVGRGGSVIRSVPYVWRVTGLNLTLTATLGPYT